MRFGKTLESEISRAGLQKKAFAARVGVPQTSLSSLIAGKSYTAKMLGKILSGFPDETARLTLIRADISDRLEVAGQSADTITEVLDGIEYPARTHMAELGRAMMSVLADEPVYRAAAEKWLGITDEDDHAPKYEGGGAYTPEALRAVKPMEPSETAAARPGKRARRGKK